MRISLVKTDDDIARCFSVMVQLRPKLTADEFVARVRRNETEGYQLACAEDGQGTVRAVAGFRMMDRLHVGRVLYVDDLVTDAAARSQGYGNELFDWLAAHARADGCSALTLDSGTQRVDAHRFYLRKRMKISAFHFELPL